MKNNYMGILLALGGMMLFAPHSATATNNTPTTNPTVVSTSGQGSPTPSGYGGLSVGDHVSIRFWDSPPNDYVHGARIDFVETGGNYGDGSPAMFNITYEGRTKTFTWNQLLFRAVQKEV